MVAFRSFLFLFTKLGFLFICFNFAGEMPLLKRKPFSVLETPDDLKPEEMVFQIRFTKEIFRDYRYIDTNVFLLFGR